MLFLLAQAAPPADFIRDHPTIVAWALGLLLSLVVAEATLLGAWIRSKFEDVKDQIRVHRQHVDENHAHIENRIVGCGEENKKRLGRIEDRLDDAEKDLVEYREHVGAGEDELRRMNARVEKHMTEEETQVWGAMREIQKSLADMKVENVEAHGNIIAGRTQLVAEVAALGARITTMEPKVSDLHRERPNGELRMILSSLQQVLDRLPKDALRPPRGKSTRGTK
jgi:chromosome segregation ATPase